MIYSTGSHTKFYHRYHVVWVTKYRFKVLRGPMRERNLQQSLELSSGDGSRRLLHMVEEIFLSKRHFMNAK